MYYEPDTLWGRTMEGEDEVTMPRHGLSLAQRPGSPQPRTAPRICHPARAGSVAALPGDPWKPPLAVYVGAVALGMALAIILLA